MSDCRLPQAPGTDCAGGYGTRSPANEDAASDLSSCPTASTRWLSWSDRYRIPRQL